MKFKFWDRACFRNNKTDHFDLIIMLIRVNSIFNLHSELDDRNYQLPQMVNGGNVSIKQEPFLQTTAILRVNKLWRESNLKLGERPM